MPSRRRRRTKNVGTNLAEVQRRLRYLERRPIKTRLQRNVVTTDSIAVNAVTPDEVSFGTGIVTSDDPNSVFNPKEGLLVVDPDSGAANVYSEEQKSFVPVADPIAEIVASSKSTVYYSANPPVADPELPFAVGDTWFDTNNDYALSLWNGSAWVPFQLSNNALGSIAVEKLLAGTITAAISITSPTINGGTITGATLQTSTGARQIRITNSDDIIFYKNNVAEGIVTGIDDNQWDSEDPKNNWDFAAGVIMTGNVPLGQPQGKVRYPAVAVAYESEFDGIAGLFGNSKNAVYADHFGVTTQGDLFQSYADVIDLAAGWGSTFDNFGNETLWNIYIGSRLVLGYDQDLGPLAEGTGAPTSNNSDGLIQGQVIFKYT